MGDIKTKFAAKLKGFLSNVNIFIALSLFAIWEIAKSILPHGSLLTVIFIGIFFFVIVAFGIFYYIYIEPGRKPVNMKAQVANDGTKILELTNMPTSMPAVNIINIILSLSSFYDNPAPTGLIEGTPMKEKKDNIRMLSKEEAQTIKSKEDIKYKQQMSDFSRNFQALMNPPNSLSE